MRRKILGVKRAAAALLTCAMVLQAPFAVLAGPDTNPYRTVLESDTGLIDGQPGEGMAHKHYYGGTYSDNTTQAPASVGRLQVAASYGNGNTTAYKFGWIRQGSSGSFLGWKFDFNGIIDKTVLSTEPTQETEEAYYISDQGKQGALSITYPSSDPQGFNTTLGYGVRQGTAQGGNSNQPASTIDMAVSTKQMGTLQTKRSAYSGSTTFYPEMDGEWRNGEAIKVYDNGQDMKLEVRLSVKPSPDKKYILTEYTVYNANTNVSETNPKIVDAGRTDGGRTVWFSAGTDIMIAQDDGAAVWSTEKTGTGNKIEGLHGQSNNGATYTLGSFDLLTYHPQMSLGIQKRDASDPSKLTTWVGHYRDFTQNYYTDLPATSYMPNGTNNALDSGLAYSMRFDLLPGETKTGTFAWSMKGPTYYVDPVNGNDSSGNGHMGNPYKSIKQALQTIGNRTPEIVFINVMGDIEVAETLTIPAGKDITISTTDYVKDPSSNSKVAAYPILLDSNNVRSNQVSIKRAAGFNGDMFKLGNASSALRLTDIILDGSANDTTTGALVNATAGLVDLQTGAVLKNNKINKLPESFTDTNGNGQYDAGESFTDTNGNGAWDDFAFAASAVEISGTANFSMSTGGEITGNTSYQGAAVRKQGTGSFTLGDSRNSESQEVPVLIHNNVNATGGKANTQLAVTKSEAGVVTGAENKIKVLSGLTSYSNIGIGTMSSPEKQTVPIPVVEYASGLSVIPYSVTNFPADKAPGQWTEGDTREYIDLYASEYAYKVDYVRADNGASLASSDSARYVVGKPISVAPKDLTAQGYIYSTQEITPANHGLSVDTQGRIQGYMPSDNLNIIYKYVKNAGIAKFFKNDGSGTVTEVVSAAGAVPTASLPAASRTGYTLRGWYEMTDVNGDGNYTAGTDTLAATPITESQWSTTPVQLGTKYYVAQWDIAPDTYLYDVKYQNNNSSMPITFKSEVLNKRYLDSLTAAPITVPGYVRLTQSVIPRSAGTFTSGTFTGTMPMGAVNVLYKYKVDPATRFTFKVEHVDGSGADVDTARTVLRPAETRVTAEPMNSIAYTLQSKSIVLGDTATAPIMKISDMVPTGETVGFDADGRFVGYMPNQDVTVRYVYRPSSDYYVVQKFIDTTNNERIGNVEAHRFNIGDNINLPFAGKYGYTFGSGTVDKPAAGSFSGSSFTGTMIGSNVNLTYNLNRDPAFWKTVNYQVAAAPYDKGSVSGVTSASFLKNDGSTEGQAQAHTFAKIKELGNVATATANPAPYYKFDGWYKDAAGTVRVTDDMTFDADVTLYAKFVEDPAYWIDIHFAENAHGSVTGARSLHTYYDHTWGNITAPAVTPEVNYLFDKWTVDGANVSSSTALENGKTYYANFKKDPAVWGTEVGHANPVGSLMDNGKGQIKVNGVYAGNVYVVTDLDGTVIDVIQAPADGSINFTDLYPGTRYNVYEGTPDTTVAKGANISTATGTQISAPKEVLIPAVGSNYNVGYDPSNDGKVQIVVNPADPDSDYALIDENGNVVPYTDSDNGWKHATDPSNPRVVFDNLDPNATYTVVARKKGDTTKAPHDKLPEGTAIIANPGDEFEVPKYIVETKGGIVEAVGDVTVGTGRYTEAKRGELVKIHAEATDANGNAFKYWIVMNGQNSAVVGRIPSQDFQFTMEASNIVLKAVYERAATQPSTAIVEEEIRGGNAGDFALNPDTIARLESELTTDADRTLMDVNGADVRYKLVFNKREASGAEKTAVKAVSESGLNHEDAHTAAWALDIFAERYVDGRLVARATASDAAVAAVVQLNAKDLDMLDYELFDVTDSLVPPIYTAPDYNPEETAGLFEFDGNVNHSYVLVYSKAFKLSFVDNNPVLDHLHLNDLSRNFFKKIKIRRNEAVTDADYSFSYADVLAYADGATPVALVTPFEDIYGTQYDYVNWSTKNMPTDIAVFNLDTQIKKHTVVYAYYDNNRPQVQQARTDLTNLIGEAETFADDPFVKAADLAALRTEIENAKAVLAKMRDDAAGNLRQANYAELQAAFDSLKALLDRLKAEADAARSNYTSRTGGGSGGGGGSAGRGKGTTARPLEATAEKTFTLGVNGTWQQDPATGKYQYLIYGGMPLNNTWGKIQHADESGKLVTDWYFFDDKSNMVTGWYRDAKTNTWYFLSTEAGKNNGKMLMGWLKDAKGDWYFLDPESGAMRRGWNLIGDKWYYFATSNTADGRAEGSLYVNTTTPDGYKVNANGEWVQ